jgi:endonuclease/exonuclease/phosphatase family metal-dependent hydrolase
MNVARIILLLGLSLRAQAEEFTYKGEPKIDTPAAAWSYPDRARLPQERVRVASYNIEHFTDGVGDEPERTPERMQVQASRAAAFLGEIRPDVVLLMEIENATSLSALNDAMDEPFPVGYVTKLGDGSTGGEKLNLAVLSRLPVLRVVESDFGPLAGPGRPTRGFLRAELDLGEAHRLVVYAVHLKSNFGYRPRNIAQRRATLELMAADALALAASDPQVKWEMLVAGDTNVDPELPEFAGDPSLKPLKQWKDLWLGRPLAERTTLPTRYGDPALEFPPACFDRLLASRELTELPWKVGAPQVLQKGVETRRVTAQPGEGDHVSDHYPIYVDILR